MPPPGGEVRRGGEGKAGEGAQAREPSVFFHSQVSAWWSRERLVQLARIVEAAEQAQHDESETAGAGEGWALVERLLAARRSRGA